MNKHYYQKEDMLQVIHLMDADGTYIPDDILVEVPTVKETVYNPTNVITADIKKTIERNKRKSANMDRLASLPSIAGIPYLAVYMSCNLDHVLYNKVNSADDEKRNDAHLFVSKYRSNIPAFISFISKSDFSVTGDRTETWDFIREGIHSIERYTNLGLCFSRPDISVL